MVLVPIVKTFLSEKPSRQNMPTNTLIFTGFSHLLTCPGCLGGASLHLVPCLGLVCRDHRLSGALSDSGFHGHDLDLFNRNT